MVSGLGNVDALISEYACNPEPATRLCVNAIGLLSEKYKALPPDSPERPVLENTANKICDSYDKYLNGHSDKSVDLGKEALGITDHYEFTGKMSPRAGWLQG